ncbi:MAG: chemotaxis protein CheX [Syntrophobacteraceae bacterium]
MVLELEPVLKDVISEILETMFFAMVEFKDCGREDRCFDYESEIELQNHEGRIAISLQLSEEFSRMITAGFLGIEENQVKDEDLRDSMKELVNMIGGGYLARIKDAAWKLGIPRFRKIGPDPTRRAQAAVRLVLSYLEEPVGSAVLSYLPG